MKLQTTRPRWMSFRENYRILSPLAHSSPSLFLFLVAFSPTGDETIVYSVGLLVRQRERERGWALQHRSTETVKFPALVLTAGALSCRKSIAGSSKSGSSEIYENAPPGGGGRVKNEGERFRVLVAFSMWRVTSKRITTRYWDEVVVIGVASRYFIL